MIFILLNSLDLENPMLKFCKTERYYIRFKNLPQFGLAALCVPAILNGADWWTLEQLFVFTTFPPACDWPTCLSLPVARRGTAIFVSILSIWLGAFPVLVAHCSGNSVLHVSKWWVLQDFVKYSHSDCVFIVYFGG